MFCQAHLLKCWPPSLQHLAKATAESCISCERITEPPRTDCTPRMRHCKLHDLRVSLNQHHV